MARFDRSRISQTIYKLAAFAFCFAAVYHLAALIAPGFFPPSPAWRHSLFLVVNLIALVLAIRRWIWFWIQFAFLTAQQIAAHGIRMYHWWVQEDSIDILSLLITAGMPLMLVVFILEFRYRMKQNAQLTKRPESVRRIKM